MRTGGAVVEAEEGAKAVVVAVVELRESVKKESIANAMYEMERERGNTTDRSVLLLLLLCCCRGGVCAAVD